MDTFIVGDVVTLRSGGPDMTVIIGQKPGESALTCLYYNEASGLYVQVAVHAKMIKLVRRA